MTLTAPIPLAVHPPIRIEARVYRADLTGLTETATRALAGARDRIEVGIMRRLDSTPWSTIDGDTDWELTPEPGKPHFTLIGTWRQRTL